MAFSSPAIPGACVAKISDGAPATPANRLSLCTHFVCTHAVVDFVAFFLSRAPILGQRDGRQRRHLPRPLHRPCRVLSRLRCPRRHYAIHRPSRCVSSLWPLPCSLPYCNLRRPSLSRACHQSDDALQMRPVAPPAVCRCARSCSSTSSPRPTPPRQTQPTQLTQYLAQWLSRRGW